MLRSYLRTALPLSGRLNALRRKVPINSPVNADIYKENLLRPILSTVNFLTRSMGTERTDLTYTDIAALQNNKEILLIDVRNPDEVKEGSIPGSVNIPLGDLEVALQLKDKDFEMKYNLSKPHKDTEMVFSCRSGNRSRKALDLAQKLGFNKSKHYVGGWLDWVEQNK